jgi:hypothetical protein
LVLVIGVALVLSGCASQGKGSAAQAVVNYLKALAARDLNGMIAASCADWEADARTEYDSFTAVTLELKDLQCQQVGGEGDSAKVTCSGSLIANYGAEDLVIDIADRPFRAVLQAGEWRMCGYSQE